MQYARQHVAKMFAYNYRRAIAISLIVFALSLSIGVALTSVIGGIYTSAYSVLLIAWTALVVLTGLVIATNLVDAHHKTIKWMSADELKIHTKHVTAWLSGIIVGTLMFALPLPFVGMSYYGPLLLMLSFAGLLLVMYVSMAIIFGHHFHELVAGAAILLILFSAALFVITRTAVFYQAQLYYNQYWSYSYLISIISIIVVSGATGFAMMAGAARILHAHLEGLLMPSAPRKQRRRGRPKRRR